MKRGLAIAAIAAAVIGIIAVRAVRAGRRAIAVGDAFAEHHDTREAVRSYEAAARWYVPLAPHVEAAYRKLHALTGSPDALAAWRAIRSAARATRSLWQPHVEELAEADVAIAKAEARDPEAGIGPVFGSQRPSVEAREPWLDSRLRADSRPELWAAILASFGILAGLGGVGWLVWRGLDANGRVIRRPALAAGAVIAMGLACWLVGLYNA
ncbi:hypothetical protein BH11MYX1_BH11MYX1_56090 [soil metagenome]